MEAFASGFGICFALIAMIGVQNVFVLRQALRRQHVFMVCLLCVLSDALLILCGVFAFRYLSHLLPFLVPVLQFGGAFFLIVYGGFSLYRACFSSAAPQLTTAPASSALATALQVLGLTWLNPHVYLDTVFFLGAVSTSFPQQQAYFAAGAILSSGLFFAVLGSLGGVLAPFFATPQAWRMMDVSMAVVMFSLAGALLFLTPDIAAAMP